MRLQLLSVLVAGFLLVGCQKTAQTATPMPVGPVEAGGFIQQWAAPLNVNPQMPLTRLYLRGEFLYAYSAENAVYALSASGGQILWQHHLGQPGDQIMPPLLMEKNVTVLAGISTIEKIDEHGRLLDPSGKPSGEAGMLVKPIEIGHSIRSPLSGAGNFVYGGLDYPRGGRLAKIDLTKPYNNTIWEFVTPAGISAAPVLYQAIVYAAGEDGRVYAVNEARDVVWPLPDGVFQTEGGIVADLKADNTGLYVASTDTKLYALDLTTGRIKWQYFASAPLTEAPEVTADSVYQPIRGQGLAAIDKTTGEYLRKPRWIVTTAKRFLAEDAQYVYLQNADNSIIGVDKKTGEQKLRSTRNDLVAFASNPKGNLIYAATSGGQVLGIKPVTKPGAVGQVVKIELEFEPVAMAK